MNRRGQTLVLFVMIIPIFLLLLAFVVDTGYLFMQHTKLESTTKTILKTTYKEKDSEDFEKKVFDLYEKNNIPTENLKIDHKEKIEVQNHYEIESIFGKMIGLKYYEITIKMKIYSENDQLIIVKE